LDVSTLSLHDALPISCADEEAGHAGISDRYGATGGDLSLERRNHAASAPQDVAETHGAELRTPRCAKQDDLFGEPLRCTHDTDRSEEHTSELQSPCNL